MGMITDWKPESYTDAYVEALNEAIEAKASGAEIVAVSGSQTSGGVDDVADILARLEQSIKVKETAEKPVAKKAAPKKAAAPRRKAS